MLWLVYIDNENGCDRESWSVFYVEPLVFQHKPTEAELTPFFEVLYKNSGDDDEYTYAEYRAEMHAHFVEIKTIHP